MKTILNMIWAFSLYIFSIQTLLNSLHDHDQGFLDLSNVKYRIIYAYIKMSS